MSLVPTSYVGIDDLVDFILGFFFLSESDLESLSWLEKSSELLLFIMEIYIRASLSRLLTESELIPKNT